MLATPELIEEASQPRQLAGVLPRYLEQVPLYSKVNENALLPFPSELETLRRFPLITKQDIRRDFPSNFLGPDTDLESVAENEQIELEHTSGTSEERTPLLLPRGWWSVQEKKALGLNPAVSRLLIEEPDAHRVTINSPVCSSEVCYTGVPSREERTVGTTRFLSLSRFPFLWSERELARMVEETIEWKPRFLDLDPVYGVIFARYCKQHRVRLPSLAFVLCSYEFLSCAHRRILMQVFGVPVYDLYGSTETGHLLMEAEAGRLRPSLATGLLEVIGTGGDNVGELVVTTLSNPLMPLIRYRIGDLAERLEMPYGTRYVLHGRVADAFWTAQGKRITTRQVDQSLADIDGVAHYQLHQRRSAPWLLRYVADAAGPSPEQLALWQTRLTQLLNLQHGVKIESTDLLLAESSGKFRLCYPEGSTS